MATKVTDLFDNDWKRYRAIADVTGGIALLGVFGLLTTLVVGVWLITGEFPETFSSPRESAAFDVAVEVMLVFFGIAFVSFAYYGRMMALMNTLDAGAHPRDLILKAVYPTQKTPMVRLFEGVRWISYVGLLVTALMPGDIVVIEFMMVVGAGAIAGVMGPFLMRREYKHLISEYKKNHRKEIEAAYLDEDIRSATKGVEKAADDVERAQAILGKNIEDYTRATERRDSLLDSKPSS